MSSNRRNAGNHQGASAPDAPEPEAAVAEDSAIADAEASAAANAEAAEATEAAAGDGAGEPQADAASTVPAEPTVDPPGPTVEDVSAHDAAVASYRRNNPGAGLEE